MKQHSIYPYISALLLSLMLLFAGCSDDRQNEKSAVESAQQVEQPDDIIARIGDEVITYGELNAMLNSSAMLGHAIPELGTPERNQKVIALLDNAISANLIYLDAKKKGIDRLTSYTEDVDRFEDAIIASSYKTRVMQGESQVSELEVLHHYNTQTSREVELNDDTKLVIESMLRRKKLDELQATLRERLRENVKVEINDRVLSVDYDAKRSDADIVATYGDHRISWSQVKDVMRNADQQTSSATFYIDNDKERRQRLDQFIDNAIMTLKGRAAGIENDPDFIERSTEYRKARLINEHRNGLIHSWNPSDDDLRAYFNNNRDRIVLPEARRVQLVTVETREEAADIKMQIDNGDITLFQAAQQYSINPDARTTLGDMGWVSQGSDFDGLGDFTFNLQPGVVSHPVETPAGWHLVRVRDIIPARFDNLEDPQTRERTFRAYMQSKFNDYVIDLRKNHFEVAVYQDELQRQFQREADFIAELNRKAQEESSTTEQRMEEIQQLVTQPTQ